MDKHVDKDVQVKSPVMLSLPRKIYIIRTVQNIFQISVHFIPMPIARITIILYPLHTTQVYQLVFIIQHALVETRGVKETAFLFAHRQSFKMASIACSFLLVILLFARLQRTGITMLLAQRLELSARMTLTSQLRLFANLMVFGLWMKDKPVCLLIIIVEPGTLGQIAIVTQGKDLDFVMGGVVDPVRNLRSVFVIQTVLGALGAMVIAQ